MSGKISRRAFGKLIIGGALALGAERIVAESLKFGGKPGTSSRYRRNIATLPANHSIIETYRDAVTQMRALPASDPRNWTRQAEIHDNFCPHGNWFFLPWHRAYLFYFEEICRTLTGNNNFALPYWNWSLDGRIPAAFWGDASNPLFDATRFATETDAAEPTIVGQANVDGILTETDFELFASGAAAGQRDPSAYGRLEGEPHNYVHGFVGGNMATFMSPLDPLFWTHHNVIDCFWVDWNINRGNPNTTNPAWLNFTFSGNFVDGDGNPVNPTVEESTLLMLQYRFEPCMTDDIASSMTEAEMRQALGGLQAQTADAPPEALVEVIAARDNIVVSIDEPVTVPLDVAVESVNGILDTNRDSRVILTIGEVTLPTANDFFVRVFVNHPNISASASPEEPYYAGSFAFFVDPRHTMHANMKPEYFVDLTDTIQRLQQAGLMSGGALEPQLLAVPIDRDRALTATSFALEFVALGVLGIEDEPLG